MLRSKNGVAGIKGSFVGSTTTSSSGNEPTRKEVKPDWGTATLVIHHEGARVQRLPLSNLRWCREALAGASKDSWAEVMGEAGASLLRPVFWWKAAFGLVSRQHYGVAKKDLTSRLTGKVLTSAGERIKTGGWELPYAGEDTCLAVINFPDEGSPAVSSDGEKWARRTSQEADLVAYLFSQLGQFPGITFAYAGGKGLHLVSGGTKGWSQHLTSAGVTAMAGGKLAKRAKFIGSPVPVSCDLASSDVSVRILTVEDVCELAAEFGIPVQDVGKAMDGISLVTRSFMEKLISIGWSAEEKLEYREWLESTRVWTLRGFVDGRFLKTVALVVEETMYEGADLVVHPINLKPELVGPKDRVQLFAFPQDGKDAFRLDVQTGINISGLFSEEQLVEWGTSDMLSVYHKITSGAMVETMESLWSWDIDALHGGNMEALESVLREYRHRAAQFMQSGRRDFRHSPTLARKVFEAHVKLCAPELSDEGTPTSDELHIPIPGSVYWQVLPELVSWVGGMLIPRLQPGEMLQDPDSRIAWVRTQDALDMAANHGGNDWDDKFGLVQLTDEFTGMKAILAVRLPNMAGEYSVWTPVTDWQGEPVFTKTDVVLAVNEDGKGYEAKEVAWPTADLSKLPEPVSELLKHGELKVGRMEAAKTELTEYTPEALRAMLRKQLGGSNPGGYINALMFFIAVMGRLPKVLPFSMEGAIDAAAQMDHQERNLSWVLHQASQQLVAEALASGRPVDRTLWESRGFRVPKGSCLDQEQLKDTWITRVQKDLAHERKRLTSELENWISQEATPCPTVLAYWAALGGSECKDVQDLVRSYRRAFAEAFGRAAGGPVSKADSDACSQILVSGMKDLGLAVAALQAVLLQSPRKSDGKLSDGAVFASDELATPFLSWLQLTEDLMSQV